MANLTCDTGYILAGSSQRTCLQSGMWSGVAATCNIVLCPVNDLTKHLHANVNTSGLTHLDFSTGVRYSCTRGYKLLGAEMQHCLDTGHWSSPTPTCTVVTCPHPGEPESGVRIPGRVFVWQQNITVACARGHQLVGDGTLVCTEHGNWSAPVPQCQALLCNTSFASPANAVTVTSAGVFQPGIALPEYTVILAVCQPGYTSYSNTNSVCHSGQWQPAFEPRCMRHTCPPIKDHGANTQHVGGGNLFGDVVSYRCQYGHEWSWPLGTFNTSCTYNMTWSALAPDCHPVQCPPLADITSGSWNNASLAASLFNTTAVGHCDHGYELASGNLTRTCQHSRRWTGDQPSCQKVTCPQPTVPANGEMLHYRGNTYLASVSFRCDDGYELSGVMTVHCQANRTWSADLPTCVRVTCSEPLPPVYVPLHAINQTDIVHGDWQPSRKHTFGAVFVYSCNPGYYLQNTSYSATCLQNHSWSAEQPECLAVRCSVAELPIVLNGRHNNTIGNGSAQLSYAASLSWTCDLGYTLSSGDAVRTCVQMNSSAGYFSGSGPTCSKMQCPVYPLITNGILRRRRSYYEYGDRLQIQCIAGHELPTTLGLRNTTLECLANSTWSDQFTECSIISCPPLADVPNANSQGTNLTFNSGITYSCHAGFEMTAGTARRSCLDDKTWSGSSPTCTRITCKTPTASGQESVTPTSMSHDWNTTVDFICNAGYLLNAGQAQAMCADDGKFDNQHPGCSAVQCLPLNVANAQLSATAAQYGDNITVTCDRGFELSVGKYSTDITCQAHGNYSIRVPAACTRIECDPLPTLSYSHQSSTNVLYQSVVDIICDSGYVGASNVLSARYQCAFIPNSRAAIPYGWVNITADLRPTGCAPVSCLYTPTINNFIFDNTTLPASLQYLDTLSGSCDLGYELTDGDLVRSCVVDVRNNGVGMLTGSVPLSTVIILDTVTTSADMEMNISTIDL
ncbi:sushi, von Willebrand factor type A, EGF and pentraxin domain-containing protein 1-like [Sycon ciliatum]|uniref:sushi, von Willebrand factor type A, EGF and pentraxin domain-containing protein 1-like n=1 Tax=Sycon ciliatum TaxID=27933 RepID=UPI0031F71399